LQLICIKLELLVIINHQSYGEYVLEFSINRSSLPENLVSMKLFTVILNIVYYYYEMNDEYRLENWGEVETR